MVAVRRTASTALQSRLRLYSLCGNIMWELSQHEADGGEAEEGERLPCD